MIRKITLLLIACVGMFGAANAQKCGFDERNQQMLATNPAYAQQVAQMDAALAAYIQNNSNNLIVNTPNGPVYEVPVVLHVMHTGGAIGTNYNPSDAQLIGMINYLNQSYAATYPSYPSTSTGGTFIPLQFKLAQRTPTCGTTNGINRVDASGVTGYVAEGVDHSSGIGADEATLKLLSVWPTSMYYNIWIVNKIDGADGYPGSPSPFVAGYAYFPGAGAPLDGTIMLASQAVAGEITLPHEIGHAFSLYHTFEGDLGGTTCPTNVSCTTDGDRVCDTDPHIRSSFNCPTGTNPCTGISYGTVVHNFMDYSSCQDRFTLGQKTRVLNALLNSTSRSGLISSLGGTPTTAPAPVSSVCSPTFIGASTANAGPRTIKVSDANLTYMNVTSSGYSGDGQQVYIDNTCKHMMELTSGNIYNVNITVGFQQENIIVFIDYNNDGTFQANEQIYTGAGTNFSFQYTVPNTATIPGLISCVPLRMRVISDRTTAPALSANGCGSLTYGQAEDYTVIIRGGGPATGAVTAALTNGTNPSCFNSPLTFTATPMAGVTNPSYVWYINGVSTGVTSSTFSTSAPNNGDVVTVKMYFIGTCGNDSALSAGYTVLRAATVPPTVTLALTSGTNPGCAGQMLTFTAIPTNGGTAPTYQWKVNGAPVAGATGASYSAVFANNDVVTVDMVSNSSCAVPTTATSDADTIVHQQMTENITIGITSGSNPTCAGKPITFTALTTNAGTNPQIQWYVNGTSVPGATGATYTTSTLANGNVITAIVTATDPCVLNPSDTSNAVTISIAPVIVPSVAVAITDGSNPGCLDSLVEFTATVTNHGTTPIYEWLVNGNVVTTGLVYSSNTLLNGDVVVFRSIATDGACYSFDTMLSAPIVMGRYSTPAAPVISLIGNMLVANVSTPIVWFGPGGQISGTSGQSYHPTQIGTYYAVVSNNGCYSAPSNMLTIALLTIDEYNLEQVKVYPNPSKGFLTFDWAGQNVNVKLDVYNLMGQGLMHEEVRNQSHKVMDLSHLVNGTYFVVIREASGKTGTIKMTLNK
jgi:hypothetical protein